MRTIRKDKILISETYHIFPNGEVNCFHERNNPFNMFAIQFCQLSTMEVSRNSKFSLKRGAVFPAVSSTRRYHQRPLVRGGLEISFQVTIKLTKSECIKAQHWAICCFLAILDNFDEMKLKVGRKQLRKERHQQKCPSDKKILDLPIPSKLHKFLNWLKLVKSNIAV